MKEYGGYIELESYSGKEYYPDALAFNSGRAALRFFIRVKGIKKVYLPAFCCSTVWEACEAEGISWAFYSVDEEFRPIFSDSLSADEWFYLVNFYGGFNDEVMQRFMQEYPRLIVDYTHAFFQRPQEGMNVLYSCRKFFGVPDGAYLFLGDGITEDDERQYAELPQDVSYERMHFLLGRYEAGASPFYQEYVKNNDLFLTEPVKRMSKLTHNLLRAVDYPFVRERRTRNFAFLHRHLGDKNMLALSDVLGAYAYPFWFKGDKCSGQELRKKMIAQHIYIPMLWPEVGEQEAASPLERKMAESILPIPVDQRYGEEEMEEILEILLPML